MRLSAIPFLLMMGMLVYPQASNPIPKPDVRSMLADVFPVSQVKPGMKGYGLTVFKRTKIERFEVEVIGVLEQANLGRPLVMVRMKGGPITERDAMIIAGMSGSPIYLNGKILGAIAYGFAFPREPVGLVTPLEDMLTEFDPKASPRIRAWSESFTVRQPIRIGEREYAGIHIGVVEPSAPNLAWARPLMTPIMVSGLSQRTMKRLKERLERFGMTPIMAPSGGTQRPISVQFEPGAALGGAIATGDIDLTAIGTLTYRKGDYVLGFGHPFFGFGKLEMPMTAAEIVDVFSSYLASFKLGNRAQEMGTIYQDGAFAIAGKVGHRCAMMPIRVRVTNTETGISRTFACEMVQHPLLTGLFLDLPVYEFIDRVYFNTGYASAQVRWSLATNLYGTIRYENRVATSSLIAGEALNDLLYVVNLLQNAPEGEVRLESLDIEVVITPGRAVAFVENVQLDKPAYRPGERVQITVGVRPPNANAPVPYTLSLRLPHDMMPGTYRLQVGAPSSGHLSFGGLLALLGGEIGGGTSGTESALREFQRQERNYQLVATLTTRTPTATLRGVPLYEPPPVLRTILTQLRHTELVQEMDQLKQVIDTDWVLQGSHMLTLTVLPPEVRDGRSPFEGGAFEPPSFAESAEDEEEEEGDTEPPSIRDEPAEVSAPSPADEEGSSEAGGEQKTKEKPVSRKPQYWRPTTFRQLRLGKLEGVAIGSEGQLRLAPQLMRYARLPGDILCGISPLSDGTLVAGVGVRPQLVKLSPTLDRSSTPIQLEGTLITAIARAGEDTLYVGVSPEGIIYRVQGERVEAVLNTGARYVNALVWDEGVLYIATGAPARLLAWNQRTLRTLLTSEETHFSALTLDAHQNLYVGTSEQGIVYRISPEGVSAIADLPEPCISALICADNDTLYIGTLPRGNLYRLRAHGRVEPLHPQGRLDILSISLHTNQLFAYAGDGVYRVNLAEERPSVELVARHDKPFVNGVPSSQGILLFSADGSASLMSGTAEQGYYTSPVLDAGQQARWGMLRVAGMFPEGTEVLVQTRSGNTREPDATWSGWTASMPCGDSVPILSQPARFLQVRFLLKGKGEQSPVIHQFSVSYMSVNRPPEVRLRSPQPYAILSGKQTLQWSARDPDGDTLHFEPQLSADGGITWTALKDAKPTTEQGEPEDKQRAEKTEQELLNELMVELERNPDLPEEVRAQIIRQAPQLVRQMQSVQVQMERKEDIKEDESAPSQRTNRYEWDTTKVPDGVYLLRLVATDQPSMPTDYATVYSAPIPIAVCNTPPVLFIRERTIQVQEDGSVILEGFALQRHRAQKNGNAQEERAQLLLSVPITAVQYRIGNSEWVSAEPLDGMFDSGFERFRIRTDKLPPGEHTLTILVFNGSGKTAQIEQKVTIP